jgi:hypothetical protein
MVLTIYYVKNMSVVYSKWWIVPDHCPNTVSALNVEIEHHRQCFCNDRYVRLFRNRTKGLSFDPTGQLRLVVILSVHLTISCVACCCNRKLHLVSMTELLVKHILEFQTRSLRLEELEPGKVGVMYHVYHREIQSTMDSYSWVGPSFRFGDNNRTVMPDLRLFLWQYLRGVLRNVGK